MKRFASTSTIILLLFIATRLILCVNGEVDKTSTVTKVIDGDTFDISTGERIRLADVDCPEYYESGYSEATDYLSGLIGRKTVYLDIDDVYTYDYNGKGDRVVCVAYVDYNSTHLMNVNEALLTEGHAVISNFYNEFNPYSWSLLALKYETPEDSYISPYPVTPTPAPFPVNPTPNSSLSPPNEFIKAIGGLALVLGAILILAILETAIKRNRQRK
jgi:endonuclease YncB( thermonuclease family)